VAVGGLGAGGRGLYALDLTDPTAFTAANAANIVLWEFSSANDAELGYTYSQPIIAMMNNGQWAAIVGSGYNDTSANLNAHLFIIFLEGGVDGVWTDGSEDTPTDYVKIEGTVAGIAERNGLSSPAVADLDRNGTADRVYVGDLLGNLWAFDTSSDNTGSWSANKLFTATDAGGNAQPITAKPAIAKHPGIGDAADNQPNVMVYFGTGQYLTDADKTTTGVQSFYGVWDKGDVGLTPANLQQQTFEVGFNNQVVTDTTITWDTQYGWYVNLPDSGNPLYPGERVVADAILRGGIVFFNSILPSDDPCGAGGSGFLYALDMINGGRPDEPPFDTNGDAVVDLTDVVADATRSNTEIAGRKSYGVGFGTPSAPTVVGNVLYTTGTSGQIEETAIAELEGLDTGRLSWQQLFRD
jgi:type IV pilus assembly protein PilY1